jgi:hypothetical protein
VKAFARGGHETQRFAAAARRRASARLNAVRIRAVFPPLAEIIAAMGTAAVVWIGSAQVLSGRLSLGFDPELLYIGAMFHDLGLNEQFRGSGRRFEVDSADEARRFLQSHGVPEDSIRGEGIAPRPETTFGNVKADVLERFVPGYQRTNFVDIIENSAWPE